MSLTGVLFHYVSTVSDLSYFTSHPYKEFSPVFLVLAICPVAVALAELAALMNQRIILERCCYLCSMSKPIILTQFYVNPAVSWHSMALTHAQRGSCVYYLGWLSLSEGINLANNNIRKGSSRQKERQQHLMGRE